MTRPARPTRVTYPQVKQVRGHNLSKDIIIGTGLIALIFVRVAIAAHSASWRTSRTAALAVARATRGTRKHRRGTVN